MRSLRHLLQAPRKEGDADFALVSSLLVMVALAVLGGGAYFLTLMNLRTAENTRSSTVAYQHAHEGLDVALQLLAREFYEHGDGTWPLEDEVKARMPTVEEYRVLRVAYDAPDASGVVAGGTVTVQGFGPREALYETGARFIGKLTPVEVPGETNPLFGTGWLTDAHISINGNTTFYVPLWAGGKVSANATRVLAGAGQFAHAGFVGGKPAECKIKTGNDYVNCDSGQASPDVPHFDFDAELSKARAERPTCSASYVTNQTVNVTGLQGGASVCLGEGVRVTLTGVATDLYVLGPRSATVAFNASSRPAGGAQSGLGIKAVVGAFEPGANMTLNGMNTIFTAASVLFSNTGYAVTAQEDAEGAIVRTFIGTEKGILFKGNASGQLAAVLWANGHVCKSGGGGLDFRGTILARGEGTVTSMGFGIGSCSEGIYWNGGGGGRVSSIDNADIPQTEDTSTVTYAAAGIQVASRRP